MQLPVTGCRFPGFKISALRFVRRIRRQADSPLTIDHSPFTI
jgi:hypothetical protein